VTVAIIDRAAYGVLSRFGLAIVAYFGCPRCTAAMAYRTENGGVTADGLALYQVACSICGHMFAPMFMGWRARATRISPGWDADASRYRTHQWYPDANTQITFTADAPRAYGTHHPALCQADGAPE